MSATTRTFGPATDSVQEARRFAADCLRSLPEEQREVLVLLVSELAANAVVHTKAGFVLRIEDRGDCVEVEVTDFGPGEPSVRGPDPARAYGRGLLLVEQLSDSWGVTPGADGAGKTVWVCLARHG